MRGEASPWIAPWPPLTVARGPKRFEGSQALRSELADLGRGTRIRSRLVAGRRASCPASVPQSEQAEQEVPGVKREDQRPHGDPREHEDDQEAERVGADERECQAEKSGIRAVDVPRQQRRQRQSQAEDPTPECDLPHVSNVAQRRPASRDRDPSRGAAPRRFALSDSAEAQGQGPLSSKSAVRQSRFASDAGHASAQPPMRYPWSPGPREGSASVPPESQTQCVPIPGSEPLEIVRSEGVWRAGGVAVRNGSRVSHNGLDLLLEFVGDRWRLAEFTVGTVLSTKPPGAGRAAGTVLHFPSRVSADRLGNSYVAEPERHVVWKISPAA